MFRPALTIVAGRTLGYVALFVLPLILVRLFDQEQFGTYKQIFLLYATVLSVAQLGMSESLFYFLPGAGDDSGSYVFNSVLVLGGIGFVGAALLALGGDTLARWMNNPALAPLMPLLALFFLLMLASYVMEIVMTSRHQYGAAAASYAVSDVGRAVLLTIPVLFFPRLETLLYGAIVFAAIRLGAAVWYCRSQFGAWFRPDWALLTRQVAYSVPFAFYVLFQTGQETLHQYAVSSLFDAATFAVYSVGCLQVPLVDLLSTSVANVMMVGMVQSLREGRESVVMSMWHDTVRKLALVFIPLVTVLLITAHDLIVFLFTDAYAASVPIFRTWCVAILLAAIPMDGLLRVYAKTPFLLVINVVRLLLVAAGMYWLVPTMGLVGAVLVTVAALAVGKAMGLASMMTNWRVGVSQLLPWRHLAAIAAVAAAASAPALWTAFQVQASSFARLGMIGSLYCAAYVALAWMFGVIHKSEQEAILKWIQPKENGLRLRLRLRKARESFSSHPRP